MVRKLVKAVHHSAARSKPSFAVPSDWGHFVAEVAEVAEVVGPVGLRGLLEVLRNAAGSDLLVVALDEEQGFDLMSRFLFCQRTLSANGS